MSLIRPSSPRLQHVRRSSLLNPSVDQRVTFRERGCPSTVTFVQVTITDRHFVSGEQHVTLLNLELSLLLIAAFLLGMTLILGLGWGRER